MVSILQTQQKVCQVLDPNFLGNASNYVIPQNDTSLLFKFYWRLPFNASDALYY
jgi:hypothetical protein